MTSIDNSSSSITVWSDSADLEHGPPHIERVVLRVNGLKSGCCGTSVTRAASRICSVKKHQLNLVTAQLDLDLETNQPPVSNVIRQLNNKTGYTFVRQIPWTGQTLDLVTGNLERIQEARKPYGVIHLESSENQTSSSWQFLNGHDNTVPSVTPPPRARTTRLRSQITIIDSGNDKKSLKAETPTAYFSQLVQIHYDATTVGARDLFDYYRRFDPSLRLAPPSKSTILSARLVQITLCSFLLAVALTVPILAFAWAPLKPGKSTYTHISLGLATAVQCVAMYEFVPTTARMLYHAHWLHEDMLIALGTSMAYSLSVVSYVYRLKRKELDTISPFQTSTLLVTFVLLGRVVNEIARYQTVESVSFRSLQTDEALVVKSDPNAPMDPDPKTMRIDARLLQHGDRFKVSPHSKVVTDGIVICGGSEVDESRVTGGSIPVAKGVQSVVYAGTTNGSGTLIVEVTALPHENTIHRIATKLEDRELVKPRIQVITDRIAVWLVPAIVTVSLATFLVWLFVQRYDRQSWEKAVATASSYAIPTLVITSPCAIRLTVPTIFLVARGIAARHGITIRNPRALESTRLVTDVVFQIDTEMDNLSSSPMKPKPIYPPPSLASTLLNRGIAVHTIDSAQQTHYLEKLQQRKGSVVLLTDRAAGEEGLKGIQGSKALCCVVDNIMDVSTLLSDIYNMY
ncbi:hypothetical protein IAQ61_010016 [Plenodomus lingam]|uniref:uncharacterized protein n=1 Tax=Leptosphaeria maculans TaxID=5022 RepID=UPI0033176A3D|nr:hypothetical protein IAQ61_010016 [Plenodomus lingam]